MANPTNVDLINQVRSVLNETTANARAWTDDEIIEWLNAGFDQQHRAQVAQLGGGRPNAEAEYWRQMDRTATLTLSAGVSNVSPPAGFGILRALIDTATGMPLSWYDIKNERRLQRGRQLSVLGSAGYYTYTSNGIRVMVFPGRGGVPGEARDLTLYYWTSFTHLIVPGAAVPCVLEDEWCEGPVNYAVGKGLAKFRDSPSEAISLAQAQSSMPS